MQNVESRCYVMKNMDLFSKQSVIRLQGHVADDKEVRNELMKLGGLNKKTDLLITGLF